MIVDKTENYEKVRKEISEKIDISGQKIVMEGSSIDDNLIPVIRLICTGLTIILLIVSVVMMVIMIHNDILGRKKELSVYLVQGYTKKSLRQMLGVEYMMRLVPALLWAIVGTFGVLAIGSNVIKKMFPWEHTLIQLKLSASGLVASIVMMCIILAVATYTIHAQLSKINLLKEIKSEG